VQTTFIVRLLNKDREVLAWTKLVGESRGDGSIWPTQHFVAEADTDGDGTDLCFHWPEVNVHLTVPLEQPIGASKGKVVEIALRQPMLTIISDPRPLPAVTVRSSVQIGVPMAKGR